MKRILAFTFFLLFLAAFAFISLDGIKRNAEQQDGATAQPALDFVSSHWRLADTGGTVIENGGGVFVRFEADGNLNGFAGCNSFFGNYTVDADGIAIGPLGATRKMCPQPLMDIETTFMNALQNSISFKISGNKLQLIDEQGRVLTLAGTATE